MTLITRLNTTFTDTSLPRLISDPVWNEAGGRLLFDSKNTICHPTQSATLTQSTPLASAGENNWPISVNSVNPLAFDSLTGRITVPGGASQMLVEDSGDANTGPYKLINNASHDYAVSFWIYVPATPWTQESQAFFSKGIGNTSSSHSLVVVFDGTNPVIKISRPKSTDTGVHNNTLQTASLSAGVYRLGISWRKVSGTWKRYGIIGESTALTGNDQADTFGSDVDGIQLPAAGATWDARLFGTIGFGYPSNLAGGMGIYRFYMENLTQSGRTAEEVWAADWARGNGRFS